MASEEEEVEIDYEKEHFDECFRRAMDCFRQRNYDGALEIIRDSGLDLEVHYHLGKLKHRCLTELGKIQEANNVLAEHRVQMASTFIRNAQFKEALRCIENSGLNINNHKQLLDLHGWCKSALKEVPAVKEILKEVHKCFNANDHQGALNLIDNSGFTLQVHVNMMELKAHCLDKLGRHKDAYDVANYLWQHGYNMSRRLHMLIGDYLKEMKGSEFACDYYKMISGEPHVSHDDEQFFLKLVRDIRGQKDESSQAEGVKIEETQRQSIVAESEEKSRNDQSLELDSALDGISRITLEEKNELHDVISAEGTGTDASSSTLESSKKIMVRDGYDFVLEAQEEDLYVGHKKINTDYDFQMTLIRCTEFQLKNLEILKSLNHNNILKIANVTSFDIEGTTSNYFVVESMQRVDHYYTSLLMDFRSSEHIVEGGDKEADLRKWWNLIGPKFKKIFRDLVDGWIFILSKGQRCSCDAFVTSDDSGKILPSMKPGYKVGGIVEDLVKQMKTIVNLPHLNHNLKLDWLPKELLHLFTFLSKEIANKVPLQWLLDHHFFWESEEVVDFVYNLLGLLRKPEFKRFHEFLSMEMSKGYEKFWSEYINGGILWEIWSKGDPELWLPVESAELKSYGWYKVFPYQNDKDIVRYMAAVYSHFGDDEYSAYNKGLDVADIEQQLRSIFPNIYGYLVNAIYLCVRDIADDSQKHNVLRKLSRRQNY